MKTIYIIFAFALLFINSLFAQDNIRPDPSERMVIGLKAGGNYSNVYDTQGDNFKAEGKIGFVGGAFVTIPIVKYVGIQPEILFSQKGFRATGNILGGGYSFTRTSNYVDIPLFLALKPSNFVTFLVGPQYSYLINHTDVFANGSTTIERENAITSDNFRKNTLCFVGGFDITLNHFVIGGRAGIDMLNNRSDGSSSTPRYKNLWLQATLGYRFYY